MEVSNYSPSILLLPFLCGRHRQSDSWYVWSAILTPSYAPTASSPTPLKTSFARRRALIDSTFCI